MIKHYYNVVGVMSGTSLDGVDLSNITFHLSNKKWTSEILESETFGNSQSWINQLKLALDYSEKELKDIKKEYTKLLTEIISSFIEKHKIKNLDVVCSHVHTILHQPDKGLTLQIGNLPEMKIVIRKAKILEYKGALIFAFLGILKLRGEINVLSSVTGTKMNYSSGVILTV